MPKTATSPQDPRPAPQTARYSDNAALVAEALAKQGPPPPGTGKLVDRTA